MSFQPTLAPARLLKWKAGTFPYDASQTAVYLSVIYAVDVDSEKIEQLSRAATISQLL